MPARPAVYLPLIFGALAAGFLAGGLFLSLDHSSAQAVARAPALPVVTASTLRAVNVGEMVLLEGRVAAGNRPAYREFIIYHRDRFAGVETSGASKGQERWTSLETMAPPFRLAVADGEVAVVNSGYEFRNAPQSWRDVEGGSNPLGREGERVYGFFAGDAVTVEGRVVEAPGGRGGPGHERAWRRWR